MKRVLIEGGRLIDPSERIDGPFDLWLEGGRVGAVLPRGKAPPASPDERVDATGLVVAPGFVDLHVHLREPGQTEKEDIQSGTRAAVAGGFTSVFCMPNTRPTNDSVEVTERILRTAREVASCRVYPVGAITLGLRGSEISPMEDLKRAGCIAFSDDGRPVNDPTLFRSALEKARQLDVLIIAHCEELSLSNHPTIADGDTARRLGLQGIPVSSETADLARAVTLAAETGSRLHLAHLSCRESVEMTALFKRTCPTLSCEVAPHHLTLTDEAVERHGTNAKMYPPLRRPEDLSALLRGLSSGIVDAVATDHAPHTEGEKRKPFPEAPNGIIGLETALPVLLSMTGEGLSLPRLMEALSTAPARIAGIDAGSLRPGMSADVVLFEATEPRTIHAGIFRSKSRNSPFVGYPGRGRVVATFVGGRKVFEGEA